MKALALIAAGGLLAFVGVLILGASISPSASDGRQDACTRMWQDAMTTSEKYTARQMCDALGVKP